MRIRDRRQHQCTTLYHSFSVVYIFLTTQYMTCIGENSWYWKERKVITQNYAHLLKLMPKSWNFCWLSVGQYPNVQRQLVIFVWKYIFVLSTRIHIRTYIRSKQINKMETMVFWDYKPLKNIWSNNLATHILDHLLKMPLKDTSNRNESNAKNLNTTPTVTFSYWWMFDWKTMFFFLYCRIRMGYNI